jgi:hypothetical protein
MGAIVYPLARGCDPFAGGDGRGMANHGYHIAMPARLGAQNAEAILDVMVGDALDKAGQHSWLDGSGCGFMLIVTSSIAVPRVSQNN